MMRRRSRSEQPPHVRVDVLDHGEDSSHPIGVARRLAEDGGKIPLNISLFRALTVWWRGVGFWIVPLNILMMAISQARLLNTGKTAWDAECRLRLEYGKMDWNRVFLIIGVVFGVSALMNLAFGPQLLELWEASKKS